MYGKPKVTSVNKLRFLMLKAKLGDDMSPKSNQDIDFSKMPPPAVCLLEHLKRVNYVVMIWRQASSAIIEIPKPYDNHGWTKEGEPLWCPPGMILPASIVDLMEQELETPSEDDDDHEEEWQANITTEEAYNSESDSSDDDSESECCS